MITKLLNEVNEKIETLNNLVQDKEYFEKLDERIEKVNNYVQKQKQEIERLNNIINKINKMLEADTNCENIYYAIGVLLNKRFFDIKIVDNEELLNILGSDKE